MGEAEMSFHGVVFFFFFWWLEMAMMWLAFCHKTYKGPKGVGLIRKEGGYNVWRGLFTILPACEGHLFMTEHKCGMGTSWAWHPGIVCETIKRDDAFGSWVCCVSTTCVSWLSTDDSAVKNQGPFSIVIHASNSKRSRENYKMESTMVWVCVCVLLCHGCH